jgi:hypothetical protein
MRQVSAALIVCAALGRTVDMASGGSCAEEITRVQEIASRSATNPTAGPTAPQSLSAQLHRQPTPNSVALGEEEAQSRFAAALARAQTFDDEGNAVECMQAIANAKAMVEPNW